jgi:hypothetical protein
MSEPISIASTIANKAAHAFLARRREARERDLPLSELINVSISDDYQKRSLSRELEAITDAVSKRLEGLIAQEWGNINNSDRAAAIASVADSLSSAILSDEVILGVDADANKLARQLYSSMRADLVAADLGEPAGSLYLRLLQESCLLLVRLIVSLAPFVNRGIAELLGRTSSISHQAEMILDRLPIMTLEAPAGIQHDEEFKQRYLQYISESNDDVELFGLDVNRYRPRANLTVAYISLSVNPNESGRKVERAAGWSRVADGSEGSLAKRLSMSVEEALAKSDRTLVRGEAGSGKTTLLSWLAVAAARGQLSNELSRWNNFVPFLIRLRGYVGKDLPRPEQFLHATAAPIAGLMPAGWVHRTLSSSRSILLIDGVDELPANERMKVRSWLNSLLKEFSGIGAVVTARPAAADETWLAAEDFSAVALDRMGPSQVRALVSHWYSAIRSAGNVPCPEEDLPAYENALLSRLDSTPHLQALASNPLLCAMLCALNLDRHKVVPPDRLALYSAALHMLLERRDAERGVVADAVPLGLTEKTQLLQYLAWRLSINGAVETSKTNATKRFSERLRLMDSAPVQAADALDSLIYRSGVIREPVVGRIDFVHRTFQEYLTAKEAAENGDVGLLIREAHLDTWQETVIMATGQANVPFREELLTGLLSRAESEARHARRLRVLAAA